MEHTSHTTDCRQQQQAKTVQVKHDSCLTCGEKLLRRSGGASLDTTHFACSLRSTSKIVASACDVHCERNGARLGATGDKLPSGDLMARARCVWPTSLICAHPPRSNLKAWFWPSCVRFSATDAMVRRDLCTTDHGPGGSREVSMPVRAAGAHPRNMSSMLVQKTSFGTKISPPACVKQLNGVTVATDADYGERCPRLEDSQSVI